MATVFHHPAPPGKDGDSSPRRITADLVAPWGSRDLGSSLVSLKHRPPHELSGLSSCEGKSRQPHGGIRHAEGNFSAPGRIYLNVCDSGVSKWKPDPVIFPPGARTMIPLTSDSMLPGLPAAAAAGRVVAGRRGAGFPEAAGGFRAKREAGRTPCASGRTPGVTGRTPLPAGSAPAPTGSAPGASRRTPHPTRRTPDGTRRTPHPTVRIPGPTRRAPHPTGRTPGATGRVPHPAGRTAGKIREADGRTGAGHFSGRAG